MSFICAAMSGVGAIVQAKREAPARPESEQPGVVASRRRGHEKLGWAPSTLSGDRGHRRLLARSQEQETRCESEQGLAFIARSPGHNEPVFSKTRQGQQCHLCNREDDEE